MPTYEYECKSCSHKFEVFQQMSDLPLKVCPECGNEVRRLIFGGAGVIFKGSGFYTTDNGKSKSGEKTSAGKDSSQKSTPETSGSPSSGEAVKNEACKDCPASGASSSSSSSSVERKCPAAKSNESKSA